MPRQLTGRDLELLKKLAPECETMVCDGSGLPFRSILPPLTNHFATDEGDFLDRLKRISTEDLEYLLSLIRDGSESMGCVPPEYARVFVEFVIERIGLQAAAEIVEIYEQSAECGY